MQANTIANFNEWLYAMDQHEIPSSARLIAVSCVLLGKVSNKELMRATGLSERTIKRYKKILAGEWIAIRAGGHGRGDFNLYRPSFPQSMNRSPAEIFSPEEVKNRIFRGVMVAPHKDEKGGNSDTTYDTKGCKGDTPYSNEESQKIANHEEIRGVNDGKGLQNESFHEVKLKKSPAQNDEKAIKNQEVTPRARKGIYNINNNIYNNYPPNPPKGGSGEDSSSFWNDHLNTDNANSNVAFFDGMIQVSNSFREQWSGSIGDDQCFDLALMEISADIQPNSLHTIECQVVKRLATMARQKRQSDQRYENAARKRGAQPKPNISNDFTLEAIRQIKAERSVEQTG